MIDIKKSSLLLSVSLTALLFTACGIDNTNENVVGKAQLVSVTPIFEITSAQMQPTVSALKPGSPAFGVKGLKMIYKTHNQKGEEIEVSGLVTIPVPSKMILAGLKQQGKTYSMSIVSDQHGTIFQDSESPTAVATAKQQPFAAGTIFSAIGGFLTIQPDYIGFGTSNDTAHPFFLEEASANVVVDMIKATLSFGTNNNLPLNGQVYLTGYSEGGYVTLAAAKEIEANHKDINLAGVAPLSGPYDLNLTGMGVISRDTMARPDFIGGIINSYTIAYDYNLNNILGSTFASKLPTLYDATDVTKPKEWIQNELTTTVSDFFTPTFRGDFLTNANNALRVDFVKNSVDDYKPTSPTQLYYCSGDSIIDPRLALSASTKMGVPAIDLSPELDHVPCATPAYATAAAWFAELRSK